MAHAQHLSRTTPFAVGLLLLLGACSTAGPPAPGPEAAGNIDATVSSASSSAPPSTTSPTSAPETTADSADAPDSDTSNPESSEAAPSSAPAVTPQTVPLPTLSVVGPVLPKSAPVSMSIPAIGAQSDLLDLGLNADQTVQVPPLDEPISKAGWLDRSPTPGEVGPAILLGHVDSKKFGPGIFYNIGNLVPGDTVEVTRADGSVAIFQIDGVRSYLKSEFPTAEVYGNIDHAGLRLITCGGAFDAAASSYTSNIIAFASLVGSK